MALRGAQHKLVVLGVAAGDLLVGATETVGVEERITAHHGGDEFHLHHAIVQQVAHRDRFGEERPFGDRAEVVHQQTAHHSVDLGATLQQRHLGLGLVWQPGVVVVAKAQKLPGRHLRPTVPARREPRRWVFLSTVTGRRASLTLSEVSGAVPSYTTRVSITPSYR